MTTLPPPQEPGTHSLRSWASVVLLITAATLCSALLDNYLSLTSQAMLYVLVIVIAAYRLDWVQSAVCAVAAVTALNFFFVPPRWTFEVESREHLIALVVMLVVALVISHLASGLRRESLHAALSERRARQLQALASSLANTTAPDEIESLGLSALNAAFGGPNSLLLTQDANVPGAASALPDAVRDGMRCCMTESAVLGPGTGRWPGLNAWYLPLGDKGHVMGAACVQPAFASDADGREHAQALCALLAQTLWRVRLAASVQAAEIEAQRQQLQSTFLAAVSHDLRTPLAAIVGAASSLQTQRAKLSEAEQERLLASIASEAAYLSTLTENTLQLVRLTSVQQELKRDWESLEEIVGAVLARVRQRDPGRRIKAKVPPGLPLIKADPVLLAQLISNLLDNALKYSDGEIDLSISTNISANAPALVIAIKDRGPGIDEAEQEKIFEPYRRGDQSGPRGAGLGLALCRAIAVAHGGSLIVKRRTGGGSSFFTTLPMDAQQPELELP
jgi:two-component system sensor histidine kinase KdpD